MTDATAQTLRTRFAAMSDVGMVRERNEDSFVLYPRHRMALVADGMGGHHSGDLASALAVTAFESFLRRSVRGDAAWPFPYDDDLTEEENVVVTGVRCANQRVFERALETAGETGMGTTVVAAVFTADGRHVVIGHVGDSRCYRLRDGAIVQLTADHSLANEMSELAPWLSAKEISELPSNYITRALGIGPEVLVDLLCVATQPGDVYLLCSDGLSGMLEDDEILAILAGQGDPDSCCRQLVTRANQAGGVDNITVAIARLDPAPRAEERDLLAEDDFVPLSTRDGLGAIAGGAIALLRELPDAPAVLGEL